MGNLGKDPEVQDILTTVAPSELIGHQQSPRQDGNWQNQTEWHTVIAWRNSGCRARKNSKGSPVYAEGKLKTRQYKDNNGVERYVTEVEALPSVHWKKERTEGGNARTLPSQSTMATKHLLQVTTSHPCWWGRTIFRFNNERKYLT